MQPVLVANVHSATGLPCRMEPIAAGTSSGDTSSSLPGGGADSALQPFVELTFQVSPAFPAGLILCVTAASCAAVQQFCADSALHRGACSLNCQVQLNICAKYVILMGICVANREAWRALQSRHRAAAPGMSC